MDLAFSFDGSGTSCNAVGSTIAVSDPDGAGQDTIKHFPRRLRIPV